MTAEPSLIRTLYHGTTLASAQALCAKDAEIDVYRDRSTLKDFGPAFYMTSNFAQAEYWAKSVASRQRNRRLGELGKAAVIAVDVDLWELSDFRILAFANSWREEDYNGFWRILEWCRSGNPLPRPAGVNEPWDIVIAQVATTWGPNKPRKVHEFYDQVAFVSERTHQVLTGNQFRLVWPS